jgi:putative phage-type endonuclease
MTEQKLFYTEEELPQKSEKWLELRKTCIGGSDIASILGISSKIDTPVKLWKRKTGRLKPKVYNAAMQRGNELEDTARQEILGHLKVKEGIVNPKAEPFFAKHPEYNFVGVSFDGVDIENKFITEIKCPNYSWNFKSVLTDGIQDYYYPQVQLQLFIAKAIWGIDKAFFCSYFPDGAYILDQINYIERLERLAVLDIEYDEEFCHQMMEVAKTFWEFIELDFWDNEKYDKVLEKFKEYYTARA